MSEIPIELEAAELKTSNPFSKLTIHLFTRMPAAVILAVGRRGTGKTNLILLTMEILNQYHIIQNFATNAGIEEPLPFPISRIDNLEDLKFWARNTQGKKFFGFDEIGKAMGRRSPMSRLNIQLLNEFQTLRKFKLSTIATTISLDFIDKSILGDEILDGYWIKTDFNNPKVASYHDYLEPELSDDWNDIPQSSIPFDTWNSGEFTEKSPSKKPIFKDKDLDILWRWSHGETAQQIGLAHTQIHRLSVKFVKEVLEREHNS